MNLGTRLKLFALCYFSRIVYRLIMCVWPTFHLFLLILLRGTYRVAFWNLNGFGATSHCWPTFFLSHHSRLIVLVVNTHQTLVLGSIEWVTVKVALRAAKVTKWRQKLQCCPQHLNIWPQCAVLECVSLHAVKRKEQNLLLLLLLDPHSFCDVPKKSLDIYFFMNGGCKHGAKCAVLVEIQPSPPSKVNELIQPIRRPGGKDFFF